MKKNGNVFAGFLYILVIVTTLNTLASEGDKIPVFSGVVFEDTNSNQIFDKGEKGIPDILVSNQLEIVKTDKKGHYSLSALEDETIVYVIKPAGYAVPLNELNLPRFYFIHEPADSQGSAIVGKQATKDLPNQLNFPLYKTTIPESFDVVVMADPQTRTLEEVAYLRDDIALELIGTEALFGITLGDIMFDDLSLFPDYSRTMSMLDIPMYNVPGNHDFDRSTDTLRPSTETFEQHFGPDYYAFEYGRVSFVVLNTIEWMLNQAGTYYSGYQGYISDNQLEWIHEYLKYISDDQLIVFCMHIPLHALGGTSKGEFVQNRTELFTLVSDRKHLLALSGHLHSLENFHLDSTMGWSAPNSFQHLSCAAASGSWWSGPKDEGGIPASLQTSDGTPNGYHIFSFHGNNYQQSFKAAGKSEVYQIRIASPSGVILEHDLDSTIVAVNFFNGNHFSEMRYQIDEDQTGVLNMSIKKDPFVERYFNENKQYFTPWMDVGDSHHIWTAKLPADISPGMHKIRVTANDEFGNKYQQAAIFEIK